MEQLLLVGAAAGAIAAVGAAASVITKGMVWVVRTARKLARLVDDLVGAPDEPGRPGSGQPGLLARVAAIEDTQSRILRRLEALEELRPNGGSTVKDQVTALAQRAGVGPGEGGR